MAQDMKSARFWAQELIEDALYPGAVAIDATMGNGGDTLTLCRLVGNTGKVFAFDVQPEAIENTRIKLEKAEVSQQATLLLAGHQHMCEYVDRQADCILFNLGWLPGAAHAVTTLTETTLAAVNAALTLLKETGILTICVYPGHQEGKKELNALLEWASCLDEKLYDVIHKHYLNQQNDPPQLIAIRKRPVKAKRSKQ